MVIEPKHLKLMSQENPALAEKLDLSYKNKELMSKLEKEIDNYLIENAGDEIQYPISHLQKLGLRRFALTHLGEVRWLYNKWNINLIFGENPNEDYLKFEENEDYWEEQGGF
ncbi:MAG: hypothetical protein KJ939_07015 [Nanoarchaeota archaeon]|nr:hypothetical protein [Nanoarchaeota archaeon]MBU4352797.1 hypothetical protein [Nanoarchaeota archaeon]MCG2719143.1 hypothetical protein [Nanoarchaeota archaeon]